jgi:hypothetical protein
MIGGHGKAALRRAHAAGAWYGWELTPDEIPVAVQGLEITITPPMALDEGTVEAYARAGVDRLVVQPTDTTGATMETLIEQTATLVASASA